MQGVAVPVEPLKSGWEKWSISLINPGFHYTLVSLHHPQEPVDPHSDLIHHGVRHQLQEP